MLDTKACMGIASVALRSRSEVLERKVGTILRGAMDLVVMSSVLVEKELDTTKIYGERLQGPKKDAERIEAGL